VKKSQGVAVIALVHLVCCYVLFFLSIGIGMKSFDFPHVLTFSERVWTSLTRVLFLPVAEPLQRVGRDLIRPLMDPVRFSSGLRALVATVWFLGPLVLNSVLWALSMWWAFSRVTRRWGRKHAAQGS